MTHRLEDDLTQLFAERAAAVDVPPVPVALIGEHARGSRRTRRILVAAAVAAAVAAVAIPLALAQRDDPAPPTQRPTIVPDGNRRPTLELPYLSGGLLYAGDATVATDATSVVTGGNEVFAAAAAERGEERWSRLVEGALEPASWLDGALSVAVSADGELVASVTGPVGGDTVSVHDVATGDLLDRYVVADPGWEVALLEGFDAEDRLYWHDGATVRQWRRDGSVRDLAVEGWVGLAPAGPITWDGRSDRAQLQRVEDDGSLVDVADLPVSASAAWRSDGLLAYQGIGDGRIRVEDVTTGAVSEVGAGASARLLGWSGALVVVAEPGTPNGGEEIVTIDPVTGVRTSVGELAPGDGGFPTLRGTGAL